MEDGVHVTGKGFEAGGGDGMTEEVHGGLGKGALGGVDMETIGGQDGEHLAEMPQVVGMTGGGDEDIIQIDENKGKVAERRSMRRWKVWAALQSPKGMAVYS